MRASSVPDEFVAAVADQLDSTRTGASYVEQVTSEPLMESSALRPLLRQRDNSLDNRKLCQYDTEGFAERVSQDFRVEAVLQTRCQTREKDICHERHRCERRSANHLKTGSSPKLTRDIQIRRIDIIPRRHPAVLSCHRDPIRAGDTATAHGET